MFKTVHIDNAVRDIYAQQVDDGVAFGIFSVTAGKIIAVVEADMAERLTESLNIAESMAELATPPELKVGDWIIIVRAKDRQISVINQNGEATKVDVTNNVPVCQGIPLPVIGMAGNFALISSVGFGTPNIPPALVVDLGEVDYFKVKESFADKYWSEVKRAQYEQQQEFVEQLMEHLNRIPKSSKDQPPPLPEE